MFCSCHRQWIMSRFLRSTVALEVRRLDGIP